jgi:hypothetical protein
LAKLRTDSIEYKEHFPKVTIVDVDDRSYKKEKGERRKRGRKKGKNALSKCT